LVHTTKKKNKKTKKKKSQKHAKSPGEKEKKDEITSVETVCGEVILCHGIREYDRGRVSQNTGEKGKKKISEKDTDPFQVGGSNSRKKTAKKPGFNK